MGARLIASALGWSRNAEVTIRLMREGEGHFHVERNDPDAKGVANWVRLGSIEEQNGDAPFSGVSQFNLTALLKKLLTTRASIESPAPDGFAEGTRLRMTRVADAEFWLESWRTDVVSTGQWTLLAKFDQVSKTRVSSRSVTSEVMAVVIERLIQ